MNTTPKLIEQAQNAATLEPEARSAESLVIARPRILFLCTACPFGDISGSGVRTQHLARLLERIGPLTVAGVTTNGWTDEQITRTRQAFNLVDVVNYQRAPARSIGSLIRREIDPRFLNTNGVEVPPAAASKINELIDSHDVVWVHTLKLANALRRYHWPKSVIDVDDYPSHYHASAAAHAPSLLAKARRLRLAHAWKRREALWRERFSVLTVCKQEDCAHFGGGSRVHVVPNGFAAPGSVVPRNVSSGTLRLGMIGNFGFLPNIDGFKWFMKNVWPSVRAKFPNVEFRVIGKLSDEITQPYASERVEGLGYVPDTGEEIATWSGMIVPTRLGGGSHLKFAEGLARQVPIVTTQHGSRGYAVEPGVHALVACEPEPFTSACLLLLEHPDEGDRMAAAARRLFDQHYSWDAIGPKVESAVSSCLSICHA